MVIMIRVDVLSANSVRVSWDSIDIPGIANYTVYYSETGNREGQSEEGSVIVPSSVNSVVIDGLVTNVEYQFQVAATDGDAFQAQISMLTTIVVALPVTGFASEDDCGMAMKTDACHFCTSKSTSIPAAISTSVVVTFLLTIILYTTVLLVGCAVWRYSLHTDDGLVASHYYNYCMHLLISLFTDTLVIGEGEEKNQQFMKKLMS
jgi:hypothetical protein